MKKHLKYVCIIFLLILSTFLVIAISKKNYFVNDDTLSYFLPNIYLQLETVYQNHQIPFINYFQFLGHPILQQGQTGTFYFLWYVIYPFIYLYKNNELLISIGILLHLLIAAISMYFLLCKLHIKSYIALTISYAYAFNGFIIEVSRNWVMTSGYIAYLPLLFLSIMLIIRNDKWSIPLTIIRVILFSIGYSNYFAFILFFEIIFFFLLKPNKHTLFIYFTSLLITLIIIFPILTPIIEGFINSVRLNNVQDQFLNSLQIIFFLKSFISFPCKTHFTYQYCISPFYYNAASFIMFITLSLSLISITLKNKITLVIDHLLLSLKKFVSEIIFILIFLFIVKFVFLNTIFNVMNDLLHFESFIIYILEFLSIYIGYVILKKRKSFVSMFFNIFSLLTILSLLLSLGNKSIYAYILPFLFVFFRWPFKWYIMTQFFITITSALIVNKILLRNNNKLIILLLNLSIFSYTLFISRYSSDWIPQYQSYLSIQKPYLDTIQNRSIPIGLSDNNDKNLFTKNLSGNTSTYYNKLSYAGYDPLISKTKSSFIDLNKRFSITSDKWYYNNKDKLDAYGVSYYLYDKYTNLHFSFIKSKEFENIYEDKSTIIYRKSNIDKLIFCYSQKETKIFLPYFISGNNIYVRSSKDCFKSIIFAFFKDDDNWIALSKNRLLPITKDRYSRIIVEIPTNYENLITLRYQYNLFFISLKISIILLFLLFLYYILILYYKRLNIKHEKSSKK